VSPQHATACTQQRKGRTCFSLRSNSVAYDSTASRSRVAFATCCADAAMAAFHSATRLAGTLSRCSSSLWRRVELRSSCNAEVVSRCKTSATSQHMGAHARPTRHASGAPPIQRSQCHDAPVACEMRAAAVATTPPSLTIDPATMPPHTPTHTHVTINQKATSAVLAFARHSHTSTTHKPRHHAAYRHAGSIGRVLTPQHPKLFISDL